MINLIVVLDPNYGDLLEAAAEIAPVWVVNTQVNKVTCSRLWNAHPSVDHRDTGAVTCFDVDNTEDRLTNLLNVVPTLEEHHGEIHDDRFSFPKRFVLEVIGLTRTDSVINALRADSHSVDQSRRVYHSCERNLGTQVEISRAVRSFGRLIWRLRRPLRYRNASGLSAGRKASTYSIERNTAILSPIFRRR